MACHITAISTCTTAGRGAAYFIKADRFAKTASYIKAVTCVCRIASSSLYKRSSTSYYSSEYHITQAYHITLQNLKLCFKTKHLLTYSVPLNFWTWLAMGVV